MSRGASVLLIESGRLGGAQSAGLVRLLQLFANHPPVIGECMRATETWRKWEQDFSCRLLGDDLVITACDDAQPMCAAAVAAGIDCSTGDLSVDVFPLLASDRLGGAFVAERGGGVIYARRAVNALVKRVEGSILTAHVLGLREDADRAIVLTNEERVEARHVVVAAGTATAAMAHTFGIEIPVERDLHTRLSFPIREKLWSVEGGATLPCWIDERASEGLSIYGLPIGTTGCYAIGIGGREDDVPLPRERAFGDSRDLGLLERTRNKLCSYVARTLPGLDPAPVFERACLITQLPWGSEHMCAWQSFERRFTFVVGNNMFKVAPRLGHALSDLTGGADVPEWLDPTVPR
jgi:glycine/D-amino acid oxidase-like deaminating enzyme